MKRRDFIKASALAVPALSIFPADLSSIVREQRPGKMEKRSLGRTGVMLSVIGFGGIIVRDVAPEEASAYVKMAIDAGVNHFDVAPSYGNAELMLGPALEPYRKNVFLSCKTQKRTRDEARRELEQSLKNLRTDHFDLYQLHAVTTMSDVNTILGKGGALEAFLQAKSEGLIRFIGMSVHSEEAGMALMEAYDFDTIMYPLHISSWHAGTFGPQLLDMAHKKGMGIISLKSMAKGPWPQGADRSKYPKCWYEPFTSEEDIRMGLRFALSHPITDLMTSGQGELFKIALGLRDKLTPLSPSEVEAIKLKGAAMEPLFRYPSVESVK
ncbi:MAG TPA: aldo/keto reductase [Bacteroidales bacterium]|nr:aldo/keto reductase [Bacteroidales bacterium]HOM40962.1 aldo/keto reductase [Bacteroidales bacterium]HPP93195.1 aldo/keto reductase [Bacteroidales bacterium]HQK71595.1 aldo/keto reductase [Bacteroidales bacterium]